MNKKLQFFAWMILAFILTMVCVTAYNAQPKYYYGFETNDTTSYIDSLNNKHLNGTSYSLTTGRDGIGNASILRALTSHKGKLQLIDFNKSFSINLWFNRGYSNYGGSFVSFNYGSQYIQLQAYPYCSFRIVLYDIYNGIKTSSVIDFSNSSCNNFNMITLSYNDYTDKISIYRDGNFIETMNNTMLWINTTLDVTITNSNAGISDDVIDEMSIWTGVLTTTDVLTLYNLGNGLDDLNTIYEAYNIFTNAWNVTISPTNTIKQSDNSYYVYPATINNTNSDFYITGGTSTGDPQGMFTLNSNVTGFYYAVTCDYREQQTYIDTFENGNLTGDGWTGVSNYYNDVFAITGQGKSVLLNGSVTTGLMDKIIPYASENNDTHIQLKMYPLQNGKINFRLSSGFYTPMMNILLNYTNNRLCAYNNNQSTSTLMLCMNYNPSIDGFAILDMTIKYDYDTVNDYFTINMHTTKNLTELQSNPVNLYTTNYYIGYYGFTTYTDTLMYIDDISFNSINNLEAYSFVNTNQLIILCDYKTNQKYLTRIYYQLFDVSAYNNYKDFYINGRAYDDIKKDIKNKQSNSNKNAFTLTEQERNLILAYSLTFGFAILISIILFIASRNSEKSGGIVLIGFLFTVLAGLVTFGIIGWFSIGFALLVGILDAIFIGILFKMVFFSTSGG